VALRLPFVLAGAVLVSAAVATGVMGSAACTATTTINTALVTDGLEISSSGLFYNYTCGADSSDDVYKYLAVVIDSGRNIVAAGIFDCFADASFANLPGADAGQLPFAVWLYIYNEADYNIANANNALVRAVYGNMVTDPGLNGIIQPDASVLPLKANAVPDGGVTRVGLQRDLATVCESQATWTNVCSAVSQAGVQVSAYCGEYFTLVDKKATSCSLAIDLPDASR
jgi:hypothetical protein